MEATLQSLEKIGTKTVTLAVTECNSAFSYLLGGDDGGYSFPLKN